MDYKITDLYMTKCFQGLYAGKPSESDKAKLKSRVLEKIGHLHTYSETMTNDDENPGYDILVDWAFKTEPGKNYGSYGNIAFAIVEFYPEESTPDGPDWQCSNIMFQYYPTLDETLEGKLEEILETKELKKFDCYF